MGTLAEEYIETDAGKVQLFRGGDGPPLVYLHSAAGEAVNPTAEQLAEDMFADQSHPMAQMMHMLSEFRGDVGQQIEVPMELVLPIWKSMSATAKLGWDPYLHNPRLRKRLHRVSAPTLVIHGAQDTLAPKAISEAYAAVIPDARLVDVDGGAHLLALERPDEVAQLVREFLA